MKVYTIGVGIRGKAPFPVGSILWAQGVSAVEVDIDEDTLTKIAEKTGGRYFRADSSETLQRIYAEIDRLEKTDAKMKKFQHITRSFGQVALAGLAVLVLEMILGHTVWRKLP